MDFHNLELAFDISQITMSMFFVKHTVNLKLQDIPTNDTAVTLYPSQI